LPKDLLAENVVPKEYMLEQNYPNPFSAKGCPPQAEIQPLK